MSTPTAAPPVIRIKRKREDAPLEVLHLDRGLAKRRVTEDIYVFRRYAQETPYVPPTPVNDNGIPTVRVTQPGEEKRDPWALKKVETPLTPTPTPTSSSTPRRFHLSRPSTPSLGTPAHKHARKSDVATFIERKTAIAQARQHGVASDAHQPINREDARISQGASEAVAAGRKLKRPSAKSRVPITESRSTERGQGLDLASEQDAELLSKMLAWAEEAEKGESSQGQHEASPKAPVASNDGVDDMEIDSEGDYVYDTYVRHLVAADTEMEVMGEGAVGHLIIPDEDQDLWEAYIEDEGDSDKEFDTDDEDSNAEDYYGADYPEDEVAEDDEYGIGAYEEYRKYASDDEQWGNGLDSDGEEGEVVGSGDENDEFSTGQEFARAVRSKAKTGAVVQADVGGDDMSE